MYALAIGCKTVHQAAPDEAVQDALRSSSRLQDESTLSNCLDCIFLRLSCRVYGSSSFILDPILWPVGCRR